MTEVALLVSTGWAAMFISAFALRLPPWTWAPVAVAVEGAAMHIIDITYCVP